MPRLRGRELRLIVRGDGVHILRIREVFRARGESERVHGMSRRRVFLGERVERVYGMPRGEVFG